MGHQQVFDNSKFVPGTGTRGISDMQIIWTNPQGRLILWSCELKLAKDRQRPDQKVYEEKTRRAGGHYSICHDLGEFIAQYTQLNDSLPNQAKLF